MNDITNTNDAPVDSGEQQQRLNDLFKQLKITKLVVVDDVFSEEANLGSITANCKSIIARGNDEVLKRVSEMDGFDFSDEEIWTRHLENLFNSLEGDAQKQLAIKVADLTDGSYDSENEALAMLKTMFAGLEAELDIFSLQMWNEKKGKLIADHQSTLFLFDKDMTNNGGSANQGVQIAIELIKAKKVAFCGVISNDFNDTDEVLEWERICSANSLGADGDLLGILPKSKLRKNLAALTHTIKRMAISPACVAIKTKVGELVGKSLKFAMEELNKLSPYEFEQVVFQSSYREGVWEPDTLINIFTLFQSSKYRQLAHGDNQLSTFAAEVRKIVVSTPELPIDSPTIRVARIKKFELYDEATYINQIFKPLEVGDIFQKAGTTKKKVVIGQPCDLMIRSDGKRYGTKLVALAELTENAISGEGGFELPFFLDDNRSAWIRFARYELIPLNILDLACFRSDGLTTLGMNDNPPTSLTPSLVAAFSRRLQCIKSCLNKFQKFGVRDGKNIGAEEERLLIRGITELSGDFVKPKFDLEAKSIDFGLKRIGHIKTPYCDSLLRKFSSFNSRDAFAHDLTNTLKK